MLACAPSDLPHRGRGLADGVGGRPEQLVGDREEQAAMGDERVLDHALEAVTGRPLRRASGMSQASEKPCEVIPSAVLLLVDRLAKAMHAVSSTMAAAPSCS